MIEIELGWFESLELWPLAQWTLSFDYAGVHVCFTQLTRNGLAIFSDPENMSRPLFYGKSVAK